VIPRLRRTALLLFVTAYQICAAEPSVGPKQRPDWLLRTDMTFAAGDKSFPVYQDPLYRGDVLIYDGNYCWLINTESQTVSSLGCGLFEKVGERLTLVDSKAEAAGVYADGNKRLAGVDWLDAIWDCSSWYSLLFRRPDFSDKTVRIWMCDTTGWATLRLPAS